jgi:hypothetical protein
MPASVPEAAYELAIRSLDQQERRVEELRSRSATLIAAASVAASVLAARPLGDGAWQLVAVLALVAYAAAVLGAARVLLPRDLQWHARSGPLLDDRREVAEVLADAAVWLERLRGRNARRVIALERTYAVAVAAVGVEVLAGALSVGGKLWT